MSRLFVTHRGPLTVRLFKSRPVKDGDSLFDEQGGKGEPFKSFLWEKFFGPRPAEGEVHEYEVKRV